MDAEADTPKRLAEIRKTWKESLARVRELSRKDRTYLLHEIDEIILEAQQQVNRRLTPSTALEGTSVATFPEDWQTLLKVKNESEMNRSVASYKAALDASRAIKDRYQDAM